jgi:hypothetical protein
MSQMCERDGMSNREARYEYVGVARKRRRMTLQRFGSDQKNDIL